MSSCGGSPNAESLLAKCGLWDDAAGLDRGLLPWEDGLTLSTRCTLTILRSPPLSVSLSFFFFFVFVFFSFSSLNLALRDDPMPCLAAYAMSKDPCFASYIFLESFQNIFFPALNGGMGCLAW